MPLQDVKNLFRRFLSFFFIFWLLQFTSMPKHNLKQFVKGFRIFNIFDECLQFSKTFLEIIIWKICLAHKFIMLYNIFMGHFWRIIMFFIFNLKKHLINNMFSMFFLLICKSFTIFEKRITDQILRSFKLIIKIYWSNIINQFFINCLLILYFLNNYIICIAFISYPFHY